MSSALSQDGSQRSWWPLSNQSQKSPSSSQVFPTDRPHSHSKQSGLKFNIASAMGFKQKKSHPPPLTIHDPPRIVSPPATHLVPRTEPHQRRPYTAPSDGPAIGRPPSNSVSSTRSRVDSIEPRTPKTPDDPRRGSLLTLSDTDPFAAGVVSLSPSDPNRLSAFSNSSAHEQKSTPSVNRVSYASSSSQSFFRLGGDLSPLSVVSPVSEAGSSYMRLANKKSAHSLRRKDMSTDSKTWLSDLGVDNNRFSQPDPPPKPRPPMRARGMTDTGMERSNFLRNDPFIARPAASPKPLPYQSATSPKRQISLSRPTAPPIHDLPPPPRNPSDGQPSRNSAGSTSSTSLTFSAEFMPIAYPSSRVKSKPSFEPPTESGWEPEQQPRTHRTLRKSMSHQSLNKRVQSTSSSSSSSFVPIPDPATIKAPRKQRSFHRAPVHPVPLQLPLSEQRASDPLQSSRKRLFSTSSGRRPSTATPVDDTHSLSLNTAAEPERTASTSCWIETDQPPRSPTSVAHEYTPQQIMSPAEMLKVEASVDAAYQRPRTASIVSASTALSDFEHDFGHGLSPGSSFGGGRARSNSDHPSVRSSGATSEHGGMQDMFYHPMAPQPPSPPVLMSLPPPPRRTKPPASSSLTRSHSDIVTPLSPPPRKTTLRPKVVTVEERMQKRQSLLRKPSFLDIDDEIDKEPPAILRHGSFLDLARGSFESSEDSLDYN
ncbi:hypothetical protein DFH07DRAFT_532219 [Mycena maculata]|uniref:Uncharacterized protein n=1 Tax=Mycena maculata TaxID=230809 RepID=A0AAD7N9E8_9AGAR|nr:hypothetical protein DFH07DRAFT_532219 [Mycena maculata]